MLFRAVMEALRWFMVKRRTEQGGRRTLPSLIDNAWFEVETAGGRVGLSAWWMIRWGRWWNPRSAEVGGCVIPLVTYRCFSRFGYTGHNALFHYFTTERVTRVSSNLIVYISFFYILNYDLCRTTGCSIMVWFFFCLSHNLLILFLIFSVFLDFQDLVYCRSHWCSLTCSCIVFFLSAQTYWLVCTYFASSPSFPPWYSSQSSPS